MAPTVVWAASILVVIVTVIGRRRASWFLVAAVLLGAFSASSMALRVAHLNADPMASWAEAERHITATGVLTSDPTLTDQPGFAGVGAQQVRVQVRLEEVTVGADKANTRTPVLVIGDGSGWQSLRLGDEVELTGSLAPARGVEPIAAVLFTSAEPVHTSPAPRVLRAAEVMRAGLRDAVAGLPEEVQGLLPALVVGDISAMPPLLTSDLRDSGLAHLTAVSGANVAIVVGAALLLARWAGLRAYVLVSLGLVVVVWFVLLARPQPSVLRAAVMGALALVAVGAAGRLQAARTLMAAAVILLLVDPWLARSWGFALSVAATAGLVFLARRWSARLPARWPQAVRDVTAVALAAQVATLPLVVALSGQIAVLSIVVNVLAAPAVPVATVLGAASAFVSPMSPSIAQWLAWLAQWPTAWIAGVAAWAASTPIATLPWPDGWLGAIFGLALMAASWWVWRSGHRRGWWTARRVVALATAASCLVVAYLSGPGRWPPPGWVLVACDVGQGDALAVNLGEGAALVVDAGPDPARVERCLDRLGIDRVPLLVLTHFHADHVGGLPGVIASRTVGTVMVSPLRDPAEQVGQVARLTSSLDVVDASPGQSGSWGEASWQVLWPGESSPAEGSAANNASVVLLVEVSGTRMLLTGDIEPEAQHALVEAGVPDVDVLKVPHHGSQYQDPEFVSAASADVAVVSVGAGNTYGHPDPGLIDSLQRLGMVVGRTDDQGAVAVVQQGDELRVVTLP